MLPGYDRITNKMFVRSKVKSCPNQKSHQNLKIPFLFQVIMFYEHFSELYLIECHLFEKCKPTYNDNLFSVSDFSSKMVKLTPDIIEGAGQYINPIRDRELDLRQKIVNCEVK